MSISTLLLKDDVLRICQDVSQHSFRWTILYFVDVLCPSGSSFGVQRKDASLVVFLDCHWVPDKLATPSSHISFSSQSSSFTEVKQETGIRLSINAIISIGITVALEMTSSS